jgi:hypothetical protein
MSPCSALPNCLTPDYSGNVTWVSLDDSLEQERTKKAHMKSASMSCSMLSPLQRRISLALPSPQNSDVDEPMRSAGDDSSNSPDCLWLSHSLPSPRDSDVDDQLCSNTGNSLSRSSELTSGTSLTGTEVKS